MNILICDDDKYLTLYLKKIIDDNFKDVNIIITSNGLEAIETVKEKDIDIVFMDIEMPNINGIETSKIICNNNKKIKIIFVTAHADYALLSFVAHPYDYLLKPIDTMQVKNVIDDIKKEKEKEDSDSKKPKLFIKDLLTERFILIEDIYFFEKINRTVLIHTANNEYRYNKTIASIEEDMKKYKFLRTHQSFVVNVPKIKNIINLGNRSYQIEFYDTDKEAGLSRGYKDKVLEKIQNLVNINF